MDLSNCLVRYYSQLLSDNYMYRDCAGPRSIIRSLLEDVVILRKHFYLNYYNYNELLRINRYGIGVIKRTIQRTLYCYWSEVHAM